MVSKKKSKLPLPFKHFVEQVQGRTLFPVPPMNRRPFFEQLIKDFERDRIVYSPSGLTAGMIAMYLKASAQRFSITWEPEHGGQWVVKRTKPRKAEPLNG